MAIKPKYPIIYYNSNSESYLAYEKLAIEAILNGYDNGLLFEYCNVYNKKSPLWIQYMIGYITGYQNSNQYKKG